MKPLWYIFGIMLLALWSCKKDPDLGEESQSPIFYMIGDVDGFQEKITAGDGGYYMNTRYYRSDSILHVSGNLSEFECTSCTRSFELDWAEFDPQSGFIPEEHFSIHEPELLDPTDHLVNEYLMVNFFTEPNLDLGPIEYVSWDFGNGNWSSQFHSSWLYPVYDGQLTVLAAHNVTYSTLQGPCDYRQENLIHLESECHANFNFSEQSTLTYAFTPTSYGIEPAEYEWKIEDTTLYNEFPVYTFSDTGAYDVELTVRNLGSNCESTLTKRVIVNTSGCEANWHYTTEKIFSVPSDTARFGKVFISWTNAAGNKFQSDLAIQDTSSFIIIEKAEAYGTNINGNPVTRLEGRVSCRLRAVSSGQIVRFNNVHFSVGVAHPE